tara:strand:+ start:380 stop:661 length:282 start_codon:yes stop_codon:yes gene_type:complete
MIRWGTLMAGMLGFILVLAIGLSMGKAWERTLTSALFGALTFGFIGRWWMRLWLTSLTAAKVEHVELEAIASQNARAAEAEQESEASNLEEQY